MTAVSSFIAVVLTTSFFFGSIVTSYIAQELPTQINFSADFSVISIRNYVVVRSKGDVEPTGVFICHSKKFVNWSRAQLQKNFTLDPSWYPFYTHLIGLMDKLYYLGLYFLVLVSF